MAAPALLFDADGTLWHSYPWYASILARLTARSEQELVDRLLAGSSVVRITRDCSIRDRDFAHACAAQAANLPLYDGVPETLSALRSRGAALGIVTSLPGWVLEPLLKGSNLSEYFSTVVHAGTVRPPKPSAAPLLEAARQLQVNAADVAYIGDSPGDAKAARRAGMKFVWASYGYCGACPDDTATVINAFKEVIAL